MPTLENKGCWANNLLQATLANAGPVGGYVAWYILPTPAHYEHVSYPRAL